MSSTTTPPRPPILFIHGVFGNPRLSSPWTTRLEAAGYECHVPALPGRCPTDRDLLRRIGVPEYFKTVLAARQQLNTPPILVGHSMGGLLALKLAAVTEARAVVLLAPIPPGINWVPIRAFPHLIALLPGVLGGRAILPADSTLRAIPFRNLPRDEQDELIDGMVPDSGRAFRSMTFGTKPVRVPPRSLSCPVLCISGSADLNVSRAGTRRIVRRFAAQHHVCDAAPHWIIAESLADEVFPPVSQWLQQVA